GPQDGGFSSGLLFAVQSAFVSNLFSADVATLELTGHDAAVRVFNEISAEVATLSLSAQTADVDRTTTIDAGLAELELTSEPLELFITVTQDDTASLEWSGLPATVEAETSTVILADVGSLDLTGFPAGVSLGSQFGAVVAALELESNPAE